MNHEQTLHEIASRIAAVELHHPLRVAIDGVDCAGKSHLADDVVEPLGRCGRAVLRASIDGFHNPRRVRHQRGSESAEGYYLDSFNYTALIRELLAPLGPGGSLRYRRAVFDYRTDTPLERAVQTASADAVLLFDGVFLLRPELSQFWDFTLFVDVDFGVVLARARIRDVHLFGDADAVEHRYRKRYIPAQRRYLAECNPRTRADVVIENNDWTNPTVRYRQV
jgi:uridine kinase